MGQGTGMSGANIFVVYADGNGNVTISPRLGRGHFEPQFNSDADVTLLDGSGIIDGQIIANVRCNSCLSWDGGEMSPTDTSSRWIYSYKNGDPLDSTSQQATIEEHDGNGLFGFNLAVATGGDTSNPYVITSPSPSTSSPGTGTASRGATSKGATAAPTPTPTSGYVYPGGDTDDAGSVQIGDSFEEITRKQKIHGTIMSVAFVILFPIGAIIVRIAPSQKVNIHMTVQLVGYILAIVGLAYGVMLAQTLKLFMEYHPIIGMVVVGGLFFQPIVGLIHHWLFKSKGKRTFLAPLHVYWGRVLVILGIINGGLGLELASNTHSGKIAYGVVAGIMGLLWILAAVFYYVRGDSNQIPKRDEHYEASPTEAYERGASNN